MDIDKIQFPIEFNKCPNCGSERRVTQEVVNEEIEKGNMRKGAKMALMSQAQPIFEAGPQLIALSRKVPVVLALLDICADCGTLYCIRVDKGTGSVGTQMRNPNRQPPVPPVFGRG